MSAEQLCGLTKERGKPDGAPTVSTHLLQIQTILSVLELHQISAGALADCHRRSGISPCLEDISAIQLSGLIIEAFEGCVKREFLLLVI